MIESTSMFNNPIMVSDEKGNILLRTKAVDYYKEFTVLEVEGTLSREMTAGRVSVLILQPGNVYEFLATVKKIKASTTQLTLFSGHQKESRAATRFAVSEPASIVSLIFGDRHMPLLNPINIFVINLSRTGVLFKSKPEYFELGMKPELRIKIKDTEAVLSTTVVRIKNIDAYSTEYGCRFV